uniref:FBD domain-containing protein n=1 Tax=Quercus lobata TaxID=97700 RepID=A0A7N2LNN7_QUELO
MIKQIWSSSMALWRWSSASRRRRSVSTLCWSGGDGGDPAADAIFVAQSQSHCGHLITELPSVQSLLVHHTKVQSLRFGFSLPMLNILRSLQFDAKCCKWHILPRLLESAPNLEKLILHKVDTDGPHELCCWTDPPHVPKCLESCLWIISLVKFKCWEHDLEFVQFFLKNAKVLEKMGILTGLLDFAENS